MPRSPLRRACSGLKTAVLIVGSVLIPSGSALSKVQATTWTSVEGKAVNPLDVGGRASVVVFVMVDCPMANLYAPELARIVTAYESKGVRFTCVYVDPDITADRVRQHVRQYGLRGEFVLDPRHSLAEKLGATVSPEAVVLGKGSRIAYRGRIDDRVVDYGKVRPEPRRRDLRLAIDAVLNGRSPASPRTKAIGCIFREQ